MNLIDQQNSLIIDITYNCNAKCRYCQWGSNKTTGRVNQPDEYVYVPYKTLKHLKTERIVFSGGEPLLRNDLETIIEYYKKAKISSITTITNGFLLTEQRLEKLVDAGLTGIAFSIDSFEQEVAFITRAYNDTQIRKVKSNFEYAITLKEKFSLEIGVNVVVSSENLKYNAIEKLVEYLNQFSIDWIKFQPIFDDGYVGTNAPHLLLSSLHSELIRQTGNNVITKSKTETNPISFWNSLAEVLEGKKLVGKSCGLDTRQAIAQKENIKICSWIDYPIYDITKQTIAETQKEFINLKSNCKTGTFCYCLQKLSHNWTTE